ncbi:GntR family transcriptional regulator [Azospirillum sp. TSH100]|uniref:GntR family transcriptional regulator n=1 Tax=Azospirillum sp. TSH100 TaxID=652764 RepID=UPI000D61F83C|nr:GntR family transcriptional regulator [Azospirillum sp. TSH100]PWC84632.1 GntR family transcriptional regulator [Azospirillum sp. TSH100]QCG91020.1 GntR family transcriptional regulator [Azospirillum sp. TSH100]
MEEQPRNSQTVRTLLQLRELILNGELSPGERVSELGIVDRLGVSRTPVRVALVRLEEEGLVDCLPTGGFVVRAFSEADIADAIQLRGVLEGMAAQRAAERRLAPDALAEMRGIVAELDALVRQPALSIGDFSDYVRLNDRFHGELLALADSPVLRRSLERVLSLPFASPGAFVRVQAELPDSREILVIAQEHHRAILDAIAKGEGGRADHLAREHSRLARRNLENAVKNRRELDRVPGASLIRLRSA